MPPLSRTVAFAFALVVVTFASSAFASLASLPECALASLVAGECDDVVRVAFIGTDAIGALVVRDVSSLYAIARARGLASLMRCAASGRAAPERASALATSRAWSKAHRGASRATIAAKANERLKFDSSEMCVGGDVRRDLETLREGADVVARATLRRLDFAFHNVTRGFYEHSASSDGSLDHFHAYGVRASGEEMDIDGDGWEDAHGKHAHTDVGVAIVMTPALLADETRGARGSRGLFIGDIEPDLPDDGMIVMLGEAARAWAPGLSEEMRALLKVPTHAVRLSGERAWFGRMVLPETTTMHPMREHEGLTFGAWHDGAIGAAMRSGDDPEHDRWASAACRAPVAAGEVGSSNPHARRILADDNSCDVGYIYCWLSCLQAPSACSNTAQCIDQTSGAVWAGDASGHCSTCAPTCPARNTTSSRSGYCNTDIPATTMFMDGFSLNGGGSNAPCVALLFKTWTLHTPALMALGFFATLIMGTSIEALAALRRRLQSPGFCNCHSIPPPKSRVYCVLLYTVQVTIGYLLMLVSMTYHFVLFSAVIVGLVIGHIVFGAKSPVAATTTACCAFASPSDKEECKGCAPSPDGQRAACCAVADPPTPTADDNNALAPCCAARRADEISRSSTQSSGDLEKPLARDSYDPESQR